MMGYPKPFFRHIELRRLKSWYVCTASSRLQRLMKFSLRLMSFFNRDLRHGLSSMSIGCDMITPFAPKVLMSDSSVKAENKTSILVSLRNPNPRAERFYPLGKLRTTYRLA